MTLSAEIGFGAFVTSDEGPPGRRSTISMVRTDARQLPGGASSARGSAIAAGAWPRGRHHGIAIDHPLFRGGADRDFSGQAGEACVRYSLRRLDVLEQFEDLTGRTARPSLRIVAATDRGCSIALPSDRPARHAARSPRYRPARIAGVRIVGVAGIGNDAHLIGPTAALPCAAIGRKFCGRSLPSLVRSNCNDQVVLGIDRDSRIAGDRRPAPACASAWPRAGKTFCSSPSRTSCRACCRSFAANLRRGNGCSDVGLAVRRRLAASGSSIAVRYSAICVRRPRPLAKLLRRDHLLARPATAAISAAIDRAGLRLQTLDLFSAELDRGQVQTRQWFRTILAEAAMVVNTGAERSDQREARTLRRLRRASRSSRRL